VQCAHVHGFRRRFRNRQGTRAFLPGGIARNPRSRPKRGSHLQPDPATLPQQPLARAGRGRHAADSEIPGRPGPQRRSPGMTPARRARASLTRTGLLAVLAGALLQACNFGEPTAGGSSEVDNPVVAMVDADGRRVNVTGSLGIYLSTQSPAVNPAPVLELQLNGVDSVVLSPKTFSLALAAAGYADSLHHLNLHLQAGDSSGAFLQRLTYDPARGSFSGPASTPDRLLKLTVSPLVDAGATIGGERDSGVHRLIIPGSPFQTVLVDSTFTFRNIPPGVFPVHLSQPD